MSDLTVRLRQNAPFLTALVLFVLVYLGYHLAHPKGFSSAVLIQNADEAFALSMLAMAQTIPVLAAGLDLSVGANMTMVACFASYLLTGTPEGVGMGRTPQRWLVPGDVCEIEIEKIGVLENTVVAA